MTDQTDAPTHEHLLTDKQYFILNNLAVVVFPAVGTLYFALAQIWGLPAAEQVIGTIVALDAFLGVLVKVGEASYDNSTAKFVGAINVAELPDKTVYTLAMNHEPETLKNMDKATFKVNNLPPAPVAPPSR